MAIPCLIGDMYMDAVTRRNHSAPLQMTQDPIEDLTLVAEHVVEGVETLTLDVALTDDELVYFGADDATVKAMQKITSKDDKKQYLKTVKAKKAILDIVFEDEAFFNFVLLDIQADETVRNKRTYEATLTFERAATYQTLSKKVPLSKIRAKGNQTTTEAATRQQPTADKGEVAPEKPANEVTTKSAVAALVDALRGAP